MMIEEIKNGTISFALKSFRRRIWYNIYKPVEANNTYKTLLHV